MRSTDSASPAQRRRRLVGWGSLAFGGVIAVIAGTVWARRQGVFDDFFWSYSGFVGPSAQTDGISPFLAWLHFVHALVLILLIRSGWQVRHTRRPNGFWSRPSRGAQPGVKISLEVWTHLALTLIWLVNGLVYIGYLFVSGHWVRLVPQEWEIVPHAASAALQYVSLQGPPHDGWVSYNALQMLAYFVAVFIAAPVSALSGLRMSPVWPGKSWIARVLPMGLARAVHYPAMVFIALFTVSHAALSLGTGPMENLNHMYAATNADTWLGPALFGLSLVLMAAGWFALRPEVTGVIAGLTGRVTRG